ncbi:MAG: hypothetical protein LUC95_02690 [Lachnospiraceae bacterium]|nr:hypothetical protein [Lachnospiraceae bacterium]
MKKKMKRWLAAGRCAAMMLTCAGCGSGTNSGSSDDSTSTVSRDYVFRESEFGEMNEYLGDDGYIYAIEYYNDTFYLVTELSDSNGYSYHFTTWDQEGTLLTDLTIYEYIYETEDSDSGVEPLSEEETVSSTITTVEARDGDVTEEETAETTETGEDTETEEGTDETGSSSQQETEGLYEDTYLYNYWISPDGVLYYLGETTVYNDDWTYYEDNSFLVAVTADGTELFRINTVDWGEEYEYVYFYSMDFNHEDQLILWNWSIIVTLDMEGNLLSMVEADSSLDLYQAAFYYDGMPVFQVWNSDYTSSSYVTVDLTTGEAGEEVEVLDTLSNYNIFDGGASGYDLVVTDSAAVYGYNFGDEDVTQILNYIDSDLPTTSLNNLIFLSEDTVLASYYDITDYDQHFSLLTHVAPEDVAERTVLTLAMYYTSSDVLRKVIEFNKSSDTYKINVIYYSSYATDEDYLAGVTKFNNEIVAGNIPDIIYDAGYFDMDSYASMGILMDFYELIEADEELNLEDYCENVFRAYEYDGGLYQLVTSFRISTFMGKTSIFGEDESLTWERLNEIMEEYPDAAVFEDYYDRSTVLSLAMSYCYDEFVDEEAGTCDFTSDEFKSLLEFIAQFPDDIDYDTLYSDDYWETYDERYITNQNLLCSISISSLQYLKSNYYSTFFEDATPVGFPNNSGINGVIYADSSFAICSTSDNVEGAWEFVRSFITEEAQMPEEGGYYYRIPILKAGVEELVERMKERSYYLDDNGEKVYYDNTAWIDGVEVVIDPATDEEAQKWLDYIYSVDTKAGSASDEVTNIIFEEADAYFNGQKTVDEVCEIIQSRMSIVISEGQ